MMRSPGKNTTVHIAFLGVFLAISLVLSYLESLVPIAIGIPGIKIGLANLCVLFIMVIYGIPDALLINICRIVIAGFMFGNMSMIMYSAAGAVLSMAVMAVLLKIDKFSTAGVSICGGVFHNIGQITVACFVVSDIRIAVYLPALIISGSVAGYLIGILCNLLIPYLRKLTD